MRPIFIAVVAALVLGGCASSGETKPDGADKVFIHMKIGMAHDDNPACVAFNVAWASLASGKEVTIMYDAGAVFDLQIPGDSVMTEPTSGPDSQPGSAPSSLAGAGDYPPDMPFSLRYPLPDKLKQILSKQFAVPVERLPETYYDYLKMLSQKGARIYVNGGMAHLVSLTDSIGGQERITKLAEPITFEKMVLLREQAAVYFVY